MDPHITAVWILKFASRQDSIHLQPKAALVNAEGGLEARRPLIRNIERTLQLQSNLGDGSLFK
jgi:hypothetical protein